MHIYTCFITRCSIVTQDNHNKNKKELKGPVQESNLRLYDKKKLSSVLPTELTEQIRILPNDK